MTKPQTVRFMDLAICELFARLTSRGRPGKLVWVKMTGDSARVVTSRFTWARRIPMDTRVVPLNKEAAK